MRDAFFSTLVDRARSDPRILLLTGDLGFGVVTEFQETFPDRFLNAGIAEQNMVTMAATLALDGWKPFVYSIGNFPTFRCLEQIRNDCCYHDADVKIVAVGGGFSYGQLGISHHATEDLAVLRALPGLRVYAPAGAWECGEITRALTEETGTAYLRLDKTSARDHPRRTAPDTFALGKARVLRDGTDVTLISTGGVLVEAERAADLLSADGVEPELMTIHSLSPIDADAVTRACLKTQNIVTIEEHSRTGGLGSAVAECLMDAGVHPRTFVRLGLHEEFSSIVGDQAFLRRAYGLDATAIAAAVSSRIGVASIRRTRAAGGA